MIALEALLRVCEGAVPLDWEITLCAWNQLETFCVVCTFCCNSIFLDGCSFYNLHFAIVWKFDILHFAFLIFCTFDVQALSHLTKKISMSVQMSCNFEPSAQEIVP